MANLHTRSSETPPTTDTPVLITMEAMSIAIAAAISALDARLEAKWISALDASLDAKSDAKFDSLMDHLNLQSHVDTSIAVPLANIQS